MSELKVIPGTARAELRRAEYVPKESWERALSAYEAMEESLGDDELPTRICRWTFVEAYALADRDRSAEKQVSVGAAESGAAWPDETETNCASYAASRFLGPEKQRMPFEDGFQSGVDWLCKRMGKK